MSLNNCKDLTILVSSCDFSQDCWEPFFYAFSKFWPDCPYPRYIISNYLDAKGEKAGFVTIKVGEDKGWASNILAAFEQINVKGEFILYMQEDFWFNGRIDNAFIAQELQYCRTRHLDSLRLALPWMDQYKKDSIHAGSPISEQYSICLSSTIWRYESFLPLIKPGWSGWDFEANVLTLGVDNFVGEVLLQEVAQKEFPLIDSGVRRGRWTRMGCRFLKKNGFSHLIPGREKEGLFYTFVVWFMRINKYSRIIGSRIVVFMHRHHLNF